MTALARLTLRDAGKFRVYTEHSRYDVTLDPTSIGGTLTRTRVSPDAAVLPLDSEQTRHEIYDIDVEVGEPARFLLYRDATEETPTLVRMSTVVQRIERVNE